MSKSTLPSETTAAQYNDPALQRSAQRYERTVWGLIGLYALIFLLFGVGILILPPAGVVVTAVDGTAIVIPAGQPEGGALAARVILALLMLLIGGGGLYAAFRRSARYRRWIGTAFAALLTLTALAFPFSIMAPTLILPLTLLTISISGLWMLVTLLTLNRISVTP